MQSGVNVKIAWQRPIWGSYPWVARATGQVVANFAEAKPLHPRERKAVRSSNHVGNNRELKDPSCRDLV
jgi:hypothetical protein